MQQNAQMHRFYRLKVCLCLIVRATPVKAEYINPNRSNAWSGNIFYSVAFPNDFSKPGEKPFHEPEKGWVKEIANRAQA